MPLVVVDHPLAQHYLACLRDETTPPEVFRVYSRKLSTILVMEAARNLRDRVITVKTPMGLAQGRMVTDDVVVVPILRAGLGMLDAVTDILPKVSVGYIGLERDEATAVANTYYRKMPPIAGRQVMLVDPMLATGGSALHAMDEVVKLNPSLVVMICIVAAPQGVAALQSRYPDVAIYTASLDEGLNDVKYILPGLGDYGDRLFGT